MWFFFFNFFIVRDECERVWRLKLKMKNKWISQEACEKLTYEVATCKTHDWNAKSHASLKISQVSLGKAFPRNTRKTICLANFSCLFYQIITHTTYILITHIL